MIEKIKKAIGEALTKIGMEIELEKINVEKTRKIELGDFSSNIAMLIAPKYGQKPTELAQKIQEQIKYIDIFKHVEVAKPGFLNFYMSDEWYGHFLKMVTPEYPHFPKTEHVYNLEYVSANPTGLLHIGHARNAVIGDVIANLLRKMGYHVTTEYYVNDAGSQMDKLGSSVFVRYKQHYNVPVMDLPEDAYHGEEIWDIVKLIANDYGERFTDFDINENFEIVNPLTKAFFHRVPGELFLAQIKKDLKALGVIIYHYYSEEVLRRQEWIKTVLRILKPYTYEADGALWLKTTLGGDDKDRVLIKKDGTFTYFLPDIAYHYLKMTRDVEKRFEPVKMIDFWGADHYGYFKRMEFALSCLGFPNRLEVVFIQMVRLMKNGQEFKMSKRTGNSLTLMDLVHTLGKDSARWFLLSNSPDKHLDIDIDVALSHGNDNPMYYVQYALVRAKTILKKWAKQSEPKDHFASSDHPAEHELLNHLILFKETIVGAAQNHEPNRLINYLLSLAKLFHHYYEVVQIIDSNDLFMTEQRIKVVRATAQIIENTFQLLGIDPLEKM